MRARDMTWEAVEEYLQRDDRCVLPLGSTEQHAYLSLTTDATLAERVATEAAEPEGVPVFPVVPYGVTPYFMAYPGTVSLDVGTYTTMLIEVLGSLAQHGFGRIAIVNGHGGNAAAREAVQAWGAERDLRVAWHDWWRAPRVRAAVQAIDPDASHASWMESFPWTRISGAAVPDGHKAPVDLSDRAELTPAELRERLGDGSFGGGYQRSDETMLEIWSIAVDETRRFLTDGWET